MKDWLRNLSVFCYDLRMNGKRNFINRLSAFKMATHGGIAIMAAIATPPAVGGLGLAVDYGTYAMKVSAMQAAADAGAVGAAKELAIPGATDARLQATAALYVDQQYGKQFKATTLATPNRKAGTLRVDVIDNWTPFFAQYFDSKITPIKVSSTATLMGTGNICVLALEVAKSKSIYLRKLARLTGKQCGVFSNSKSGNGVTLEDSAIVKAETVCSAGGFSAKNGTVLPAMTSDCPTVNDPLAARAAPVVGSCKFSKTKITSGVVTLTPGTYCGGIKISGTARVTFQAGTYIIKDGPFSIDGSADITGDHAGFYLADDDSVIEISGTAKVNMTGSNSGVMAGLLFFGNRMNSDTNKHHIKSPNATNLTGTIYLPSGILSIDADGGVAQNSAYTAIIVKKLELSEGPELILNSDYGASDVPVPSGIKSSSSVVLSR